MATHQSSYVECPRCGHIVDCSSIECPQCQWRFKQRFFCYICQNEQYGEMARLIDGEPHCYKCGAQLRAQQKRNIVQTLFQFPLIFIVTGALIWILLSYLLWGYI